MVEGLSAFNRRFSAIPVKVRAAVQAAMETGADELVQAMRTQNPLPGEIEIDWTWGQAPKGSVTVDSMDSGRGLAITIYARAKSGAGFSAWWFERGTDERHHKSGKSTGRITAQPFFFPVYRALRRRVRSRITREMNKVLKSL